MTVKARRGISRSKPFRLGCRAPRTTMRSFMAPNLAEEMAKGWSATRRLGDSAARLLRRAANQAAEEQHQQRAECRDGDGAKIEITGGHASPAEPRADDSAENCPEDAEQDREDAAGRIAAGHEELC